MSTSGEPNTLIEALHAVGLERAEGVEVAWNLYKTKRPTWVGRGVGRESSYLHILFYPKILGTLESDVEVPD